MRHKRFLFAFATFAIIVLSCQLSIPYTLMQQESYALFLTTSDYLRETFAAPWPMAHLAGNFLLQFFHFPWAGPLILGLLGAMAYLLLSLFFRQKGVLPFSLTFTALLLSAVIVMASSHRVREVERFSAVEHAASRHDWPRVLRRATPEATRDDRQLLPYALLALTESGQLPDRMMRYPVRTVDDFCPESWSDRRGLAFKACLYECMGIPGEAIHNTFQAATALPHGSSFGTLRALVRLNRLKGDERLAHKYATILSHSTLHKGWGKDIPLNEAPEQAASDRQSAILNSARAPLITPTYYYNVTSLIAHGAYTKTLADRSLCGLLLQGDLVRFRQMYTLFPHEEGEPVPALYRDALSSVSHLPATP